MNKTLSKPLRKKRSSGATHHKASISRSQNVFLRYPSQWNSQGGVEIGVGVWNLCRLSLTHSYQGSNEGVKWGGW